MAEEFVRVRRKDDPDVVLPQPLAVSALPYFPDWEPVPEVVDVLRQAAEAPYVPGAPGVLAEESAQPEPTRSRKSRKADTTSEGNE